MKKIAVFIFIVFASCTTTKEFYSAPEDSSKKADTKYTQDRITEKIDFNEFDQNLSRFYVSKNTPQIAAIPITGALIDNIGFSKSSKDDYNKYEYRNIADSYKAFLFNKVSCFYTFVKGNDQQVNLKNYDVFIGNTGGTEHKALVKNEQEHLAFLTILNGTFPKTYSPNRPRSIKTNTLYTQDLFCGDKIDFKKPFYIQFKSKNKDQTIIDLFWL